MIARPLTGWQRNVIGLAVAALAAGVLIITDLYPDWSAYHARTTPPLVAAKGQSVSVDNQTWRLGGIRHLNAVPGAPDGSLPPQTSLTVVTIERTGSPSTRECAAVITDGRRRWQSAPIRSRAPLVDGAVERCSRPGPLQLSFLLPSDAVPTAVDLIDTDGAIMLRITL